MNEKTNSFSNTVRPGIFNHVKWVLVIMAWRVLGLRMEETASRYGR